MNTLGSLSKLLKILLADMLQVVNLIYVGDTGAKYGYFDEVLLKNLGIKLNNRGKLPDVVIYYTKKNWLLLIESVTSHGPIDAKRYNDLSNLFKGCKAGLIYVSAFSNKENFFKVFRGDCLGN